MSRLKKSLSLLLALVMAMSCMSMSAFADPLENETGAVASVTIGETTTNYGDLHEALDAALNTAGKNNATVNILQDITYANDATWTPVVFNEAHTLTIDGGNKTITNLPGMMFNKQGSGGHHLIMSDLTFESPKAEVAGNYGAVIMGYADSVNELTFTNIHVNNATVRSNNYAGIFYGYGAGYNNQNDGPVLARYTIRGCSVTDSTITGGGSAGALIGHAAGNAWTQVFITDTTVTGNAITGEKTAKTGILVGTIGTAQTNQGKDGGVWLEATESGNTLYYGSGKTLITGEDIHEVGRIGSTGGTCYFTAGGSYTVNPLLRGDETVGIFEPAEGCVVKQVNGVWTVAEPAVAQIGTTNYRTLSAAIEAANNGDIVTLVDNVTLESPVDIDKTVTLDLAGKTITNADSYTSDYLVGVKRGSDLTVISSVKGGAITTDTVMCGIKVTLYGEAAEGTEQAGTLAKLTLGGSGKAFTVQGKNYGVSGNGNRHGTSVTVGSNATVTASDDDGTGIYNPQYGTLTVNGGTITGHNSGIELRAGTLNVTGGTIKATAETYTSNPNGNGTTATGAAIAIAQHTTKKDITVNISGGTMTGAAALSIANPQENDLPTPTISVSGGTFNGLVKNDDARITGKFITGGLFNDATARSFMVDNGYEWVVANIAAGQPSKWKVLAEGGAVAQIGETKYTALSTAYNAVAGTTGNTVELLKDQSLTGVLERKIFDNTYEFTLDLGGKTITANGVYYTLNGAKLTVTNGTIEAKGGTLSQFFTVNSGELNVTSTATIKGSGNVSPISVFGEATINTAGTLTGQNSFALSGNGTKDKGGYTFNITGGKLSSTNAPAIYHPNSGTLTISGGEIIGTTAVYQKSGTLNITGGTITGNGAAAGYTYNGNGANPTGDALVIDNCGYPGGAPTVNISGGTFSSTNAKAVGSYAYNKDSSTNRTPLTGFISGGTFSSDPSLYLTSGKAAGKTADGKWVVGVAQNDTEPVSTASTGSDNTETIKVYKTTVTVGEGENAVTGSGYSVKVPTSDTSTSTETTIALTETEEAPIANIMEDELADVVSALIAHVEESVTVSEDTTFAFELEKTDVKSEAASAPTVVKNAEVAFKVSPKLVAYENGTKIGSVKVDNEKLANTFTFTLELGSAYANRTLNLKHYDDNGNFIETLGNYTANEKGNVEVTLSSFSIVLGSEKKAATEFVNGYNSATHSLIYSPVMNLGSNLSYRATLYFSTEVLGKLQAEDSDTYVSISYNGTTKNLKLADLTANKKNGAETGWYEYYQEVVARLMDAPITITLIVDGQPDANLLLTDSAVSKLYTTDGGSYSISVSEVLEGVKTSGTASENERALAEAIINYGTAAKNYFANPNG